MIARRRFQDRTGDGLRPVFGFWPEPAPIRLACMGSALLGKTDRVMLNGKRSVTAEAAPRPLFRQRSAFWINLQAQYDLALAIRDVGRLVEREVQTAA